MLARPFFRELLCAPPIFHEYAHLWTHGFSVFKNEGKTINKSISLFLFVYVHKKQCEDNLRTRMGTINVETLPMRFLICVDVKTVARCFFKKRRRMYAFHRYYLSKSVSQTENGN